MSLRRAIILLFLCPVPAAAQEPVLVPPVEIEADAPPAATGPTVSTGAAESVLAQEYLDAPAGAASGVEAIPGTHVRESGAVGRPVSVSLRGSDPAATLVTLDGAPLNSPLLGGADLATLSLAPLDTVTVARGGLSAAYGTDAVGGVVAAALMSPLSGPYTEVSSLLGSFGTARLKTLHVATSSDGSRGVLASAGVLASGGDFPYVDTNGRPRRRDHAGVVAVGATTKAEAVLKERHHLSLLVDGFLDDRQVPGMEQFPSDTARQRDSRLVALLAFEGPFPGQGKTGARVFVRRIGLRYDDPAPPQGQPVSNCLVTWGVGGDVWAMARPVSFLSPSVAMSAQVDLASVQRLFGRGYEAKRVSLAPRVGLELGREEWVLLSTFLRLEWSQGFGLMLVPRASLSSRPVRWLRLKASAGRSFRVPTFEELNFDAGFVRGNKDLRPEDALTVDAGFELGPLASFSGEVNYFETFGKNLILFLPRSAFLTQAENAGSSRTHGVEAAATWRHGVLGVKGAYTYLRAYSRTTGLSLPNRPRHMASGEVFIEKDPIRVSARVLGQTAFFLDRFESLSEEGRVTADLRLEFRPWPEVLVALDVLNVGDVRDSVDALQQPLPGRAFYVTVKASL